RAVLKRAFGRTASDYREMYVVREAKIMLTSTSLRIKEIATRLSFSSQAFFGKYFRHATGVSPSEYRRDGQCRADHDRL
ncbi:MAG: helix-turn-helix domain-containing protein, partial [Lepagella sp.]